jgi:hypothetical protein
MTDTDFHARRTELSNTFAAAGAHLLDYMRCAGALAAIPNTQQYVVAGDPAAIRAQLDTVDPQRRMRHGDRPELDLYFGPETGQPRRWAALITGAGHGVLQEYGSRFEHALPGQEVLEVMEILPGAANKAAEEGGHYAMQARRFCKGDNTWTDWQTITNLEYERRKGDPSFEFKELSDMAKEVVAADRASRQVANKEEVDLSSLTRYRPSLLAMNVEPIEGQGYYLVKDVQDLLATPPATTGASTASAGFALRSRVADLLHLLEFAEISTPSKGDAEQAKKAMRDVRRMLNEDPFGSKMVGASTVLTDERREYYQSWLIADPTGEVERLRAASQALLDAAIKHEAHGEDTDLARATSAVDEALAASVGFVAAQAGQVAVPEDLARDAARYRYLRNSDAEARSPYIVRDTNNKYFGPSWLEGARADEAIDTAMVHDTSSPVKEQK